MRKPSIYLFMIVGIFILLAMTTQTIVAEQYNWRLAAFAPKSSLVGEGLARFVADVEKETNGAMKIKVGYSSLFGGFPDAAKAISMGSLEMLSEDTGFFSILDKNLKICHLPYTFSGWDHYIKWLKSPLFEANSRFLASKGHHIINTDGKTVWKRGPYRVILAKRPIFKASDLDGLKLRLYESVTAKRVWRHMGCKITIIPWHEAYLALKQGMVEGITSPMSWTYGMKFHEAAPYITNINEFLQANMLSVNKKKWDKLPENMKQIIEKSFFKAAAWSNEQLEERVEKDLQMMLEEGAFFIQTSLTSFKDKIAPLAKEFESEGQWRKGLFEDIQRLK